MFQMNTFATKIKSLFILFCLFCCNYMYAVESTISVEASNNPIKKAPLISDEVKDRLKENHSQLADLYKPDITINQKADGYWGIWYKNADLPGEYVYRYSGGLSTYCAKHRPLAIYCPAVEKTFFCYGGAKKDDNKALVHMVSCYDHRTGMVSKPTILLDKETFDAHDNPVISVDDKGYIWIFSTSHGTIRPSYIHKSKKPYDIDSFELINPMIKRFEDEPQERFLNFSYFQVWHVKGKGFACFMTLYNQPARRTTYFVSSPDGIHWNTPVCIGAMCQGSYQVSFANESKVATAFNYHPADGGISRRTNIYYVQSLDWGKTWQTADGEKLDLPLIDPKNSALVYEVESQHKNIFMKDIAFDDKGMPVVLASESGGWDCGPQNDPRTWLVARFDGSQWKVIPAFVSDNNYDTGSIFLKDTVWQIIAPTVPGPQAYNPGGEMMVWESINKGQTWNRVKQLTANSPRNHNYARGVLNANPDFVALWADGHGRQESDSNLYFTDAEGNVYLLSRNMNSDFENPIKVELGTIQ